MIHTRLDGPMDREEGLSKLHLVAAVTNEPLDLNIRRSPLGRDEHLDLRVPEVERASSDLVRRRLEVELDLVLTPLALGGLQLPDVLRSRLEDDRVERADETHREYLAGDGMTSRDGCG